MKIILTRTEALVNLTSISVIDKALCARRFSTDESFTRRIDLVRHALADDSITVSELNRDHGSNKDGVSITFSNDRDLIIEFDEYMIVESTKIMTDNVETMIDIGISIYGLVRTFMGVFKKMGKRIEDVAIARCKQLNSAE